MKKDCESRKSRFPLEMNQGIEEILKVINSFWVNFCLHLLVQASEQ